MKLHKKNIMGWEECRGETHNNEQPGEALYKAFPQVTLSHLEMLKAGIKTRVALTLMDRYPIWIRVRIDMMVISKSNYNWLKRYTNTFYNNSVNLRA